jgi:hypothetical protein
LCLVVFLRSKSVKKDDRDRDRERRRRSPTPKPTKVYLGRLTRNVIKVGAHSHWHSLSLSHMQLTDALSTVYLDS